MTRTLIAFITALALSAVSCASGGPSPGTCAALGALAGAGGGAVIGARNDRNTDWQTATAGGAAGAVIGGAAAWALCKVAMRPEPPPPPPPPPRAAPAPPPPPPPPPPRPTPPPSEGVRERIVLRGVNFDFDKATIRPDAAVILDEAASILQRNKGFDVRVEGHTDSVGQAAYNQGLSERRGASVKRYLAERGVGASRLQTAGFGESRPVATNDTSEGRGLNRRVELSVLE